MWTEFVLSHGHQIHCIRRSCEANLLYIVRLALLTECLVLFIPIQSHLHLPPHLPYRPLPCRRLLAPASTSLLWPLPIISIYFLGHSGCHSSRSPCCHAVFPGRSRTINTQTRRTSSPGRCTTLIGVYIWLISYQRTNSRYQKVMILSWAEKTRLVKSFEPQRAPRRLCLFVPISLSEIEIFPREYCQNDFRKTEYFAL
jgi:hypothetical protein